MTATNEPRHELDLLDIYILLDTMLRHMLCKNLMTT